MSLVHFDLPGIQGNQVLFIIFLKFSYGKIHLAFPVGQHMLVYLSICHWRGGGETPSCLIKQLSGKENHYLTDYEPERQPAHTVNMNFLLNERQISSIYFFLSKDTIDICGRQLCYTEGPHSMQNRLPFQASPPSYY